MIQRCTCHSARVMNRGIGTRHGLKVVLAALISLSLFATPALANPGNGNGNGDSGNHGNNSDNHGNKGNAQKGNAGQKNNASSDHRKKYGKPDHVDSDISFSAARHLAVNYGLTGCGSLPPGIAKKTVPASMLGQRPYYPGYEWKIVRNDFVLIALSTSVVTAIINGVFD